MNKRKILSYILIPILSVYLFICNLSILSFADVPAAQIVQSVSGNWTYNHSYGGLGKYFTLQDTTGLETCSSLAPYFYYTRDNVTFKKLSGVNTVAYVLNKVVGVVVSPEQLQTFYNKFFTALNVVDSNNHLQNGLYDSSDNFYGYALNDITGCYFNGNGSGTVNIPSYVSNNVKIVVDNEIDLTPPYFVYQPIPSINVVNNYSTYSPISAAERENYINLCQAHNYICNAFYLKNYSFYSFDQSSASRKYLYYNDNIYAFIPFYADNNSYTDFCKLNNLTVSSNVLSFSNIAGLFYLRPIDSSFNRITTLTRYNLSDGTTSTVDMVSQLYNIGNISSNILVTTLNHDYYVYKNVNVIPSLEDKTYRPSAYTTTNYVNYNPNNDNSSQTTVSNIDNSVSNNETIYNSVDNSYSEYIDNSVIDNSSVVNNTTNIVNNYYGSSSEGGEGGEGGGSSSDGVLDTLLEGLLAFFNAIGRVLATVITGILDMFTTVLEAIASITTDLTGVTDFFGSLFGWLPDPIPQVLGVGVSVCILCAVIRFIRG